MEKIYFVFKAGYNGGDYMEIEKKGFKNKEEAKVFFDKLKEKIKDDVKNKSWNDETSSNGEKYVW